jgi:galacturan 1,4-alpha-galacturonidase
MAAIRIPSLALLLSLVSYALTVSVPSTDATSCTVTAAGAGKDDAPALVSALQTCATVTVPAGTTLNISSKINTTTLSGTHLVRHFICHIMECIIILAFSERARND